MSNPLPAVIPVLLGAAALVLALAGSGGVAASPTAIEAELEAGSRALNQSFAEAATLFFPAPAYPPGREPLPMYATALSTRLFGESRLAVRLPNVLLSALNVVLLYAFARRAFADSRAAVVAPLVLLTSPLHVIYSRVADNAPYPQVFAVGWLLCVAQALTHRGRVYWALAGAVLGAGVYTHPSATVVMPLLVGITLVILWKSGDGAMSSFSMLAGFGLLMVPWMVWQPFHGDRFAALAGHYRLYDPTLNVLQGVRDLTSHHGLSVRSYTYWQYFSPSLWFYAGEPVEFASMQHVGALLLPMCIFTIAGASSLLARRSPLDMLILGGALAGPVAAALEPTLVDLRRALVTVPFVALMTTAGYERLVRAGSPARYTVHVVAFLALIQFGLFVRACLFE